MGREWGKKQSDRRLSGLVRSVCVREYLGRLEGREWVGGCELLEIGEPHVHAIGLYSTRWNMRCWQNLGVVDGNVKRLKKIGLL